MKKILALVVLLSIPMLVLAWGRDSGGNFTYTGGAGNIVTSNSTISSSWANQSFLDVKSALSDSLSRSGSGAMLAPLTLFDSTTTTLDLRWDGSNTTGMYHNAGEVGLKIAGTTINTWTATGSTVAAGNMTVAAGNVVVSGSVVASTNALIGSHVQISDQSVYRDNGYLALGGSNGVTLSTSTTIIATAAGNYLDLNSFKIISLADPTDAQDAATKAYVDGSPTAAAKSWTTLTVGGSGCSGTGSPGWTKFHGTVHLRGTVTCTTHGSTPTLSSAITATNRPGVALTFATGGAIADGVFTSTTTVAISTAGAFTLSTAPAGGSTTTSFQLANISFIAEQ